MKLFSTFSKRTKATALVMASAMVVTASVSNFSLSAASKNRVTFVSRVKKDTELKGGREPHLVIELEDDLLKGETFFVELTGGNAEWLEGENPDEKIDITLDKGTATFNIEKSKDLLAITLESEKVPAGETLRINLRTKILKGEAQVVVDGNSTVVTSSRETFAIVMDENKGISVLVNEDIPTFYDNGTIAELRLEEKFQGAFETRRRGGEDVVFFSVTMDDGDFDFLPSDVKIKGIKGFRDVDVSKITIEADREELKFYIPYTELEGLERGGFDITNVRVTSRDPYEGSLHVSVDGDFDYVTVKVAEIKSYTLDTTIRPTSKDNRNGLIAGRMGKYRVDIKETIKDVLSNRELTFEVSQGYMIDADTRDRTKALAEFSKHVILPNGLKLNDVIMNDTKVIGFSTDVRATDDIDEFSLTIPVTAPITDDIFDIQLLDKSGKKDLDDDGDEDDFVVDFGGGKEKEEEDDEVNFKNTNKKKDKSDQIDLIISGRALGGEEVEKEITKIKRPVEIKMKEERVKVGLKSQEVSDIIISEEEAGMLQKGHIVFMFDNVDGLTFAKPPTVKVTSGNLRLGKGELIRNGRSVIGVRFEVTRPSRTASTIEISNLLVTADRTVPEGDTGLLFSGDALHDSTDEIESHYFVTAVAKNIDDKEKEEELKGQVKEISTKFTIGSNLYHVNGKAFEMDASPHIDNDRTMMPVRYLSDALGIDQDKILYHSGVTTIMESSNKIIQFKIGSNILLVNGTQIPMDAPASLVMDRTYVPVSYIASVLDVYTYFDPDTKEIYFSNVDKDIGKKSNSTQKPPAVDEIPTVDTEDLELQFETLSKSGLSISEIFNKLFK